MTTWRTEPTRQDDERLLDWLARRGKREPASSIGASYGVSRSTVLGATARIDLALMLSELDE